MDKILSYKKEIIKAMKMLGDHPKALFLGQSVVYPGSVLSDTLKDISPEKKLEFPLAEEMQLGSSIGLAMAGFLPISCFARIDFLLCAVNQLSNHLDVFEELTSGQFKAKVIIRTIVGTKKPLDAGCQHCRDHTEVFRKLLRNIEVIKIEHANEVIPVYTEALRSNKSYLIVELAELY